MRWQLGFQRLPGSGDRFGQLVAGGAVDFRNLEQPACQQLGRLLCLGGSVRAVQGQRLLPRDDPPRFLLGEGHDLLLRVFA